MGLFEEVEHTIRHALTYCNSPTFFHLTEHVLLDTVLGSAVCVIPFLIVIGLVYWFVRKSWQRRKCGVSAAEFKEMRRRCRVNEIVRLLLVCWIAGVFLFLIIPYNFCQNVFHFIRWPEAGFPGISDRQSPWMFGGYRFSSALLARLTGTMTESNWSKEMLIGNAALFVPLGFALPFVWRKGNFPRTMLAGLGCTFFVELIQPFFERSGDIDDLIFNLIGVAAGYLLFLVIRLPFPKFVEKCRQTIKPQKSRT